MSGHSKWSTIKHKKAALDAKRGKIFTKLIKEITVVARAGGGDPNANPRLRTLVEKAKAANMPQENLMRAIKKGTGELPGVHYESQTYEGYGPSGIALIVEVLTDNKNRSVGELRHAFSAHNGNLAEGGAVSWMFEKCGVVRINKDAFTEDQLLELLLDYDIKDIHQQDEVFVINCDVKSLDVVKQALSKAGAHVQEAELEWVAKELLELDDEASKKAYEFLEEIEDLDDVQNLYTNVA
jgi:YebC/PmpR family DNA-binding regulatory protein